MGPGRIDIAQEAQEDLPVILGALLAHSNVYSDRPEVAVLVDHWVRLLAPGRDPREVMQEWADAQS